MRLPIETEESTYTLPLTRLTITQIPLRSLSELVKTERFEVDSNPEYLTIWLTRPLNGPEVEEKKKRDLIILQM